MRKSSKSVRNEGHSYYSPTGAQIKRHPNELQANAIRKLYNVKKFSQNNVVQK